MRYLDKLNHFGGITRSLLAALLVSTALNCGATAALADAAIVVDLNAPTLKVGAGTDDLTTLQNLFQSANMPSGEDLVAGPLVQVMQDLKMKRMRFLLEDVDCDLNHTDGSFGSWNNQGVFVAGDCVPLYGRFQQLVSAGLGGVSPHVAVAAFMPDSFKALTTNNQGAETWSSQTLDKYKEYAYKLVRFIVMNAFYNGAPSVVFEISNEMDIADSTPENFGEGDVHVGAQFTLKPLGRWGRWLWWIDSGTFDVHQWTPNQAIAYPYPATGLAYPYRGDVRRLDRGLSPVHKIFSDAVAAVRKEISDSPTLSQMFSGKTIEMAGPALAGIDFVYPGFLNSTLEETFLDQILNPNPTLNSPSSDPAGMARFNSSLDDFSFHYYGTYVAKDGPGGTDGTAGFVLFEKMVKTYKDKLSALALVNPKAADTKLFLSEWGPASIGSDSPLDINYSHRGAAWTAAFLVEAVAQGISMGSYLMLDYGPDPTGAAKNQATLLYQPTPGIFYPKAPTNVFKMFAKMEGARKPVALTPAGGSSHLGAFATTRSNAADIVVFNYDPAVALANTNTPTDTPETYSVEFDNLPYANGTLLTVQRYLVDKDNSNFKNLAAFLASPPDLSKDPNLQMTTSLVAVTGGKLTLSGSMGQGVALYRVLPASSN